MNEENKILEISYEIRKDAPPEIHFDDYEQYIMKEYSKMLSNDCLDEKAYQLFFEKNPALVPGAFEALGCSGFDPYLGTLISQPKIGTDLVRYPDFLWLASDSLSFCPVFIEIERPTKLQFRVNNVPYAQFNQALDQITEWKSLFDCEENVKSFYDDFAIPDDLRKKKFKPQFVLIYGRRSEFDKDDFLRNKRNNMQKEDICIMSFDRLIPNRNIFNMVTVKVSSGRYRVICIPPTFVYQPTRAIYLTKLLNFKDKINEIELISEERRMFLSERYSYWVKYGKNNMYGLKNTSDKE